MELENLISKEQCLYILEKILKTQQFKLINYTTCHIKRIKSYLINDYISVKCLVKIDTEINIYFFNIKCNKNVKQNTFNHLFSPSQHLNEVEYNLYLKLADSHMEWCPKIYCVSNDKIFMEDLFQSDYTFTDDFDYEHCTQVLSALAKIHAYGFKAKTVSFSISLIKENNTLKNIYEVCSELYSEPIKEWQNTIKDIYEALAVKNLNKPILNVFNEQFKKIYDKTNQKYFTLCHGNLTRNNILFKKISKECKFINFKTVSYTIPIIDVLTFLFGNTSARFRQIHFNNLLEYYYDELRKELQFHGIELQTIFDKYTFNYLCKEYSLYSKIVALPFQIISEDGSNKLTEDCLTKYLRLDSIYCGEIYDEIFENLKDNRITREICYKLINETLQNDNYVLDNYQLTEIPNVAKGYLGQQKLLNITIQIDNQFKIIKYFVKLTPEERGQHDVLLKMNGFEREIIVFLEIFKLMEESGIEINTVIPKCFLGLKNDCLIFEYLENYKSCNKYEMLDFDHVNLMIESLAKLHAYSVIVEEKLKICLGDKFSNVLKEFMYDSEEGINAGFQGIQFINNCMKYLDVELLINKLNIVKRKFPDYVKRSKTYRNVLSHGDLWLTNAMFSYDVNGKPIHCYIIDFQYCRYLPQAHDVMCSLHLTTSNDFRKQYQEQLLLNYYTYFKEELWKYNIDSEDVINFNDFLTSCYEYEPFAMFQKTFYFQFSMMCAEYDDIYRSNYQLQKQFLSGDRYHVIHENWKMSEVYRKFMAECHIPVLEYCKKL